MAHSNRLEHGLRRLTERLLPGSHAAEARVGGIPSNGHVFGSARLIVRTDDGPITCDATVYLTRGYTYLHGVNLESRAVDLLTVLEPTGHIYAVEPVANSSAMADAQRRFNLRHAERQALLERERHGWCAVWVDGGWEVMEMRVSHAGNLCDCGGHYRWPGGGFSLGDDPAAWPTIHATEAAAWTELETRFDECDHEWRVESHEGDRCRLCGARRFVPDL